MIQIGAVTPAALAAWRISTKEVREDLQWPIVVRGESARSAAVVRLLGELRSRGIPIEEVE
jgi:hypothetical protein